ncbi:succinic semialdehyde dehydrogenase [Pseudolysinimonas sp.]|jgi:succinate-semialdehyde dehydrogenase/glutarate-semialdehyde dehydrogenase|uniref:succinic semialdehyde dehydrogenase n=1 Tax=Pseudolysinimonas sp. TaxID=2680009 RepID=UPI0037842E3C
MSGSPVDRATAQQLARDLTATSNKTVAVIAPFTGKPFYDLPQSSVADVEVAAESARAAQRDWWAAGFAHRRKVLLRAHDLLLERREALLDAVQTETGKTRGQAFEEVFQSVSATRYAALSARRVLAPQRRRGGIPIVVRTRVRFEPKGLIGVITPWNYPLSLAIMDIAPALASGNGVVQKADDQAVVSILMARAAFVDAGVPAALWGVVAGPGADIGNAVVDAADYACFTGSTATGKVVAARAAQKLHAVSLELGGKNPMIVLDDVDPVKAAADAAYGCFAASGQLCVSMERVYVEKGVAEAFTAAFAARTSALRLGSDFDYTTDVGSLATKAQFERVSAHIEDAVAKGATVLAGGRPRPDLGPYFLEPTLLANVTSSMKCDREETFGALVAVHVVDSADEAVALANDSEYGLNASVLSGSTRRALAVAAGIEAGSVNINEGYRATFGSVDAPMGGLKMSGLGRRNGPEGLLRFVESRTIANATGVLQLPRTGAEWKRLIGPMLLLLRTLKAVRRR